MSYVIESQIFRQFKGIRQLNGLNSGGMISALKCSNVELHQSEIGSDVSIKTIDGNVLFQQLPTGYKVIGMYESIQENVSYTFIYAENGTKGTLFYIGNDNVLNEVKNGSDDLDFTVTGQCNALTMSTSAYDVFVFTNGVEQRTVCFTADTGYQKVVENHDYHQFGLNGWVATINAEDYHTNKPIKWLIMCEWNGFLVVADKYGVHSSHQNDIYTWKENPQDVADAWYIDFNKTVTALASFTGGLYIFTAEDCSLLNTTPNDTTNSIMITSSGVGCYSYTSIVKHDTYLFFYDNNQKNIYYLGVTDTTGQTKPTGPVAKEIQSYFTTKIKSFKMFSCVYNTRSEIWCLVNNEILVYDYMQQEWVTRKTQDITTIALINNSIFSGTSDGKIYIEGIGNDFDGVFYPAVYETTLINLGSNTNMKKQKTPILITLDTNYINDFWVELIRNSKEKTPKRVKVSNNQSIVYAGDEGDNGATYDSSDFPMENIYNKKVVEISTPQTWYTMGIRIYTNSENQGFCINSIELKNLKGKTKTKGR